MDYQAWFRGVRVGAPQASEPEAWQEVHRLAMAMFPEEATKRRMFELQCGMSTSVVRVFFSGESVGVVHLTGETSITEPPPTGYAYLGASR